MTNYEDNQRVYLGQIIKVENRDRGGLVKKSHSITLCIITGVSPINNLDAIKA